MNVWTVVNAELGGPDAATPLEWMREWSDGYGYRRLEAQRAPRREGKKPCGAVLGPSEYALFALEIAELRRELRNKDALLREANELLAKERAAHEATMGALGCIRETEVSAATGRATEASQYRLAIAALREALRREVVRRINAEERMAMSEREREQAERCHLTGLPRRKQFLRVAESLIAEHSRSRSGDSGELAAAKAKAVIVIDLDHLRRVNNELGHDCADEVLRVLGTCIKASVPNDQHACRWGGDEFVVLLDDVSRDETIAFCDALATRFAEAEFPLFAERNRYRKARKRLPNPAISYGFALLDGGHRDFSALFEAADQAMYRGRAERRGLHLKQIRRLFSDHARAEAWNGRGLPIAAAICGV